MAYCSACGQQVEESALFCSKCGADLNQASSAEPTPPEPDDSRRVLDVPEPPPWLGWLAVPAALAFYVVGIGLYCVGRTVEESTTDSGPARSLRRPRRLGWPPSDGASLSSSPS
ncbi:MAG: zinc ribbon domain-containing protein [Chloroflexi bacterium]|nr:zinc ribbon domain-containing protein [Chloroflexota bacterium]